MDLQQFHGMSRRPRSSAYKVHVSLPLLIGYLGLLAFVRFDWLAAEAGVDPAALGLHPIINIILLSFSWFISLGLRELGRIAQHRREIRAELGL